MGAPVRSHATAGDQATGVVSLRSRANQCYVTAGPSGTARLHASRDAIGAREQFDLLDAGDGNVALRARINGLIETEHQLRAQLAGGTLSSEQEHERLRSAEEALDQCWDLLRQRRARREFGQNPEEAQVRSASEVEEYRQ